MDTTVRYKNITRYNDAHNFLGWRVAIIRDGQSFVKYFSDKHYGSNEAAFAAAKKVRDNVYMELAKALDGAVAESKNVKQVLGETLRKINAAQNVEELQA